MALEKQPYACSLPVSPGAEPAQEGTSHGCCAPRPAASTIPCPDCGTEGKPVQPLTLRALLQPNLRADVKEEAYRFCANPDCDLVYFRADGAQTFARADLTVRVGVKERNSPRPLCYCFGHSAESLREEWLRTGKSAILDAVKAEVKAGHCRCDVTNPSGACCLGDLTQELKALAANPPPAPILQGNNPADSTCCRTGEGPGCAC